MEEKSDGDGCAREEKERKTEAEVDVQFQCGLEGYGLSGKETQNRAVWRQLVRNIDRTKKSEKMRWKKICKRTKTCLNSKFKFVPMNKIKTVDSF